MADTSRLNVQISADTKCCCDSLLLHPRPLLLGVIGQYCLRGPLLHPSISRPEEERSLHLTIADQEFSSVACSLKRTARRRRSCSIFGRSSRSS
ncbi:hypothetical protein GDO81_027236 [Engystomops pustulosus]|uniref:Uncharacterized protein n=1 Tax=Engystomops pustulosus TaxID=76066 RepID=A0AAV6ZF80_ENGPU|nr:hypothetical protein GDO81_027236 [Engystomops pustulosus]